MKPETYELAVEFLEKEEQVEEVEEIKKIAEPEKNLEDLLNEL